MLVASTGAFSHSLPTVVAYAEIARVTGTLEATVKTRLFRARGHLRQWLTELWEANQ